jgi:hypothetical protein
MVVIKDLYHVNLDELSVILEGIGIERLNVISINNEIESDMINTVTSNNNSKVIYTEMGREQFINFLNFNNNFMDYNKHSLYILRNGNFLDIKIIFSLINNCKVNVGRGGSQKAHMLSPLDLRLTSYLMAIFNFDYKLINNLNTFNYISKDRYLSYIEKSYKYLSLFNRNNINQQFKPLEPINSSPTKSVKDYLK